MGTFIGRSGAGVAPDVSFYQEDMQFIQAIIDGTSPSATGIDALRVLEVLDAIKKSLKEGRSVKVEFSPM